MKDKNRVFPMPCAPLNCAVYIGLERICFECGSSFPQSKMFEIGCDEDEEKGYHDNDKLRNHSIFICMECWPKTKFSNIFEWA